jgi:hypothetical protein
MCEQAGTKGEHSGRGGTYEGGDLTDQDGEIGQDLGQNESGGSGGTYQEVISNGH